MSRRSPVSIWTPIGGIALGVLILGGSPRATAQSAPEPLDPVLRARFGFEGPVARKISDQLDLLRVVDLDGDGRCEIVIEDVQRGRIEVLRLRDRELDSETLDTDGALRGLAVADVDGDTRPDIVLLDARGRIRIEAGGGGPARFRTVEVGTPAGNDVLAAADVDGDGKADLVVWTEAGLRVVRGLATTPEVSAPMPIEDGQRRGFLLRDIDGDAAVDIVLATGTERMPLRIALGDGTGRFGAWLMFPGPTIRALAPGLGPDDAPTLASIRGNRGRVVEQRLIHDATGASDRALQLVSLPALRRGSFPFVHADLDGDGDTDLLVANPERAEWTFLLETDGRFETETVPTLAGVVSLAAADVDRDGHLDVVIASPEEKQLAWWSGAWPRDRFPERIIAGVEPVTVGIERDGAILMLASEQREGVLKRVVHDGAGFGEPIALAKVAKLSEGPVRMRIADVGDAAGDEITIALPGDGLRVFHPDGTGGYRDISSKAGAAAEIAPRAEDGSFDIVHGAAGAALLVVRDRYARTIRLDEAGLPRVESQRNAPAGASELALGAAHGEHLVLVDRKDGRLFRLPPDGVAEVVDLPPIAPTHLLAHGSDVLVLGRTGIARVRFDVAWRLEDVRRHEPPTDRTEYFELVRADLDHDGVPELIALDDDLHGFQVLVAVDGELRRALAAPVFEPPDGSDDLFQPRLAATGDCDGDGRADLVLVAFDRVLVYLQEQ